MTELEIIAKQQIEIENLKEKLSDRDDRLNKIGLSFYCIGGPLNDNKNQFNRAQLMELLPIAELSGYR